MRFTTEPDLFALLEELLRERREELADLVGACDALERGSSICSAAVRAST